MLKLADLNPHNLNLTMPILTNLNELHTKIIIVEAAFVAAGGDPFIVTSGLRSSAQQKELVLRGITKNLRSYHMIGSAVDISDPNDDKTLNFWCKGAGAEILVQQGLYMEERQGPWQHFQTEPPKSGHRWFFP